MIMNGWDIQFVQSQNKKNMNRLIIIALLFVLPITLSAQTHSIKRNANKSNSKDITSTNSVSISGPNGYINNHGYIDLGLSVKWANMNVGAHQESDYGAYYAFGETESKKKYNFDSYKYNIDGLHCRDLGEDISKTKYDVAYMKWGGSWRMPSQEEWNELFNKCKWKWTTYNGHKGYLITGPNANKLFLPASGGYESTLLDGIDKEGFYWQSDNSNMDWGWTCGVFFNSSKKYTSYKLEVQKGYTVRPVCD